MKRPLALFVIALLALPQAHAQHRLRQKGQDFANISKAVQVLEDKAGSLGIKDVSTPGAAVRFHNPDQSILHFGFTLSWYWIHFRMDDSTGDSLWLVLGHAFIPEADLYFQKGDGSWQVEHAGYKVNLKDKVIKTHYQAFPLPSGSHDFYIRLRPFVHAIPIGLWERSAYEFSANRQHLLYGAYAGLLCFAIIINLFLFFLFRRLYYLLYAVLVTFYICTAALVMEGFAVYLFPGIDLMYWYRIVPVLDMPALICFCVSFLELRRYSLTLYRVSAGAVIFCMLYFPATFFLPLMPVLILNQAFALLSFVLAMVIGFTLGRKGNRLGYFFAGAYGIWFILVFVEVLYIQLGWPAHIIDLSYVSVAIFIEAFLLAWLLVKRFQWEKISDERTKFELRDNMEKMQLRFEQEILKTQLEIQENTFREISQEIHDNIGQTLSIVKLNLFTVSPESTEREGEKITESRELVSKAIGQLRDIARALNTDFIGSIGLVGAMEQQLALLKKTGLFMTSFELKGDPDGFEIKSSLVVFRIVQELLNNVLKHAGATEVSIQMHFDEPGLIVKVKDNGNGFSAGNKGKSQGLGLRNIEHRLKLIGGQFFINSAPGEGTEVILEVPGS